MATLDSNRPVPAAIDGRKWTVRGTSGLSGATSTRRAELFAPLVDTPTARLIRNHELVHAKITPQIDPATACKRYGCTFEALQWSEDWRVSEAMNRRDLAPDGAIDEREADTIAAAAGRDARIAAGAIMANWATVGPRENVEEALVRAGWTWDEVDALRAQVESCILGAMAGAGRSRRRRRGRSSAPPLMERSTGFSKITVPLARLFDAAFPPGQPPRGRNGDPGSIVDRIKGQTIWAPVADIVKLPMPRAVKPRRPLGRRFSDAGVVPSAVHRLPTDGAIFTTKRRARGGTILCDASGSMNYCDDDIERIIRDAPAAKIAFYAGTPRGRGAYGRIVIAADRGRAATVAAVHDALPGGNNLIDGPALRWLARQPAPRFWVSDEEVGGMGDYGKHGVAHAECMQICAAAGIKVVPSIDCLK
jgi:hypothetical protein